ncbi:transcription elongation factor GreA [candidate division WWE3 bacterium]|uniref:Transcription elongation factor GreA n=1 Tax=candidate division WWE3 bacterium TaxID=2053526 RepID=A0A928TRA5_UNCKA|nr:transcription elongation factor GreA [candidate division WWE3 bacterium]
MPNQYLTKEGLEKLRKELKELKDVTRPETIQRLEAAKALGDLSENAEYHDAKDTLAFIEGRIRELEDTLHNAVLIEEGKKGETVTLGSTLDVESRGVRRTFHIVGSNEADPAAGNISNESPMGAAFLGHKKGDEVEVTTPGGVTVYTIIQVE